MKHILFFLSLAAAFQSTAQTFETSNRIEATYPRASFAIVLHDGEAWAYIDRPQGKRRVKAERLIVTPDQWSAALPDGECLLIWKDGATNLCAEGKDIWYYAEQRGSQ